MVIPEIYTFNDTQRQEKYIKKYFSEFWQFIQDTYKFDCKFHEKMYMYFNGLTEPHKCPRCGKKTKFINFSNGYSNFCSVKCSRNSEETQQKYVNTCLERYGVDNVAKTPKAKEKYRTTCIERYGVENTSQSDLIKEKKKETCLNNFGVDVPAKSKLVLDKMKETCIERYGVENAMQSEEIKEKSKNTCFYRYGVTSTCLLDKVRSGNKTISKVNKSFANELDKEGIKYEMEYSIVKYSYDFKVGNNLIELNPFPTHNINWSIFNKEHGISKDYHYKKSKAANEHGFNCIHVWDWDDKEKIISLTKPRKVIYARGCSLKEIDKKEANCFLEENHLQGSCKGQMVCLGLYYNDELIQLMTFGKPRYNKNYSWELLRLCSKSGVEITGGASKLFKFFTKNYKGSIISYCDKSKFIGKVYENLGFKLKSEGKPSRHWFDGKRHITDSLLRQRGFDQLFATNYGKGTSNEELMRNAGFVEIYDCGQSSYIFNDK